MICEECRQPIHDGEQFADFGGECYCRECLHDMRLEEIMELVGFPLRVMYGAGAEKEDEWWEDE